MKTSLQIKMSQQLTMTPQLQQAIRLLQLSTLDLQQEIQQALDANPLLEVEEDNQRTADDILAGDKKPTDSETESVSNSDSEAPNETIPDDLVVDTDWDEIYTHTPTSHGVGSPEDDWNIDAYGVTGESLLDHILWQLNLTHFSERDGQIAEFLADSLDLQGYLGISTEDAHEALTGQVANADEDPLDIEEVAAVLTRLQQFDPPGVFARDLTECLLIQLNQPEFADQDLTLARTIISEHLDKLGTRDYAGLMKVLSIKEEQLRDAVMLIQSLTPHPGGTIISGEDSYVIPDVVVFKDPEKGTWRVELNPDVAPKIRLNSSYSSLAQNARNDKDGQYIKDQMNEAKWFLKSLQSRNETLLKVSRKILETQIGFFELGVEAMKPMVLADIAEAVEMHESTISRVTTQKYMHTPRGIFELKYFFSSHVPTTGGGEASSTAIRAIIKKLIAAETPRKPLSDSKLAKLLEEQGIKVARRTVAKYRESMNIPPSNERKSLV